MYKACRRRTASTAARQALDPSVEANASDADPAHVAGGKGNEGDEGDESVNQAKRPRMHVGAHGQLYD
ncbi:hypothetical protein KFE25_011749 [Diacronema lutheri]|uniref:Uncharacterized protein n=1 Tax=Diacronema lutheri TaxID=2081491 RepID=A0A8J5X4U0_DIALT|nr:hypothetical protein KFE25_011740 [Diacronema lutheri]KAG8458365.1 hypothetical protein KFE25_011749 [Diacronema lutheri]